MLKWKMMRSAEKKRRQTIAGYTRYKNNYFLNLVVEATEREFWTDWDRNRLKKLRKLIELDYKVPINFFSAFVYFSTYKYMKWKNRDLSFNNYVGFISNEKSIVEFANFLSSRKMLWRKKNSRWPIDWEEKWGTKISVKSQKLGKFDKIVKHDINSDYVGRKINKHL